MSDFASQLDAAAKALDGIVLQAKTVVGKIILDGALNIANDAKKSVPVNNGTLRDSIGVDSLNDKGDTISVKVGSGLVYAPMVEFGTVPHQNPEGTEDFVASVTLWGQRKGMKPEEINAIIEHIRKFGTKPHPYLYPAYYAQLSNIKAELEKVGA